ncbi:hypothetical protein B0H17DRAFT_1143809 [Mycena rosella]|uniref:Uncharacterized protein n=1 Tax=Mycena rosella TaxID=1033263 RepID=A0AAD7G7E9_MYCRO|nr:hypothetical protein B0H17DRAFT_1143809 [Mycena rosella]
MRLEKCTGTRGFCVIAGSHASDTIRSSFIGSVDSVRFLPDVFRMDSGTFTTKYRNWRRRRRSTPERRWEATGKPKLDVQFVHYKELMCGKEGYEIVGWPDDVPICTPSNMGVGGSIAIDTLYEHLKNGECYWRAVDPAVRTEINKVFAKAGKKKKPRKRRVAAKADDSDDVEETEEEEEAPPLKKRKEPAVSEDEDEEEVLPKKKVVKRKRAQEEEEEEEAPPRKKAVKKKKVPVVEDEEEEETPKEKAGKKKAGAKKKKGKGKEKEKEVREKRKHVGADDGNAAPAKRVPFKHSRMQPPAGRSASIVPSDADVTDGEAAPAQSSSTAAGPSTSTTASASTSKAAASSFTTGWESVWVTDEIHQKSKEAADKMKMQLAADCKAGVLPLAKPKAKPKLTAKSLQEMADQDYGSSEED